MKCTMYRNLGLAIASFSASILLGTMASRLAVLALWFGLLFAVVVVGTGIFAALQRNKQATGGQYLELLSMPVLIGLVLLIGLPVGLMLG